MWPSTLDISPLLPVHRAALGLHLLALPPDDRHARFGVTLGDEALLRWVSRLAWAQQRSWGDLGLVGVLQLMPTRWTDTWELAMTVSVPLRGHGVGTMLLATSMGQMPDVRYLVCHHGHAAAYAMARRLGYGVRSRGRQQLRLDVASESRPAAVGAPGLPRGLE